METLDIPLSLLKVTFSEISISQVKNVTSKVLRFLAIPPKLSKPRKVIALTRETTLYLQLRNSQRMKIKIVTSVMKLSKVLSLSRVLSVLRILFSSPVLTISKV